MADFKKLAIDSISAAGRGFGGLHKVLNRAIRHHGVEFVCKQFVQVEIVEQTHVEAALLAKGGLFGTDRNPDAGGSSLPNLIQQRPVPAADLEYPRAGRAA